jgi:hypothetical protein
VRDATEPRPDSRYGRGARGNAAGPVVTGSGMGGDGFWQAANGLGVHGDTTESLVADSERAMMAPGRSVVRAPKRMAPGLSVVRGWKWVAFDGSAVWGWGWVVMAFGGSVVKGSKRVAPGWLGVRGLEWMAAGGGV